MRFKILLSLFLLFSPHFSLAQDLSKYGFKDIPFGLSYKATLQKAKKLKYGDDYVFIQEGINYFEIFSFLIGGYPCKIGFHFNHKKRFYQFTIKVKPSLEADYFDTHVKEKVVFLNEIFKKKYGNPSFCNSYPSLLDLNKGFISIYCRWANNVIYAYTGVSEDDERNFEYTAFGCVGDKLFKKELQKIENQIKDKDTSKGANDF